MRVQISRKRRSVQAVRNARAGAHAQGGRMKRFSIVNFSKSSRTTYFFNIFLNIRQHRSSDNFSLKSVRQILRYFSKFPFLTFSLIYKKLCYRFLF